MLEKYLPFLRPRENPKRTLNGAPYLPDDTLFFNTESLRSEAFTAAGTVKFSSSTIVFFSAVLIGLLTAHMVMNFLLNNLLNEQRNLEFKINEYAGVEDKALEIKGKLDYSKYTVGARKPLTTRISFVMSRIPQELSLTTVEFKPGAFDLVVKGSSPVPITGMFLRWLQDGGVSEVAIKEAIFSSVDNTYAVRLSGVYR
ncbi:MAG: hypothetical protein UU92_C0024G0007 [candidate division WWE3 bacterium GW2011_GWA1_42_12]|nr:MAG: hypothetical protein UU92_C0024G0007 [candidate division WWE3 bacterium GW2011_GWA1_42_12]